MSLRQAAPANLPGPAARFSRSILATSAATTTLLGTLLTGGAGAASAYAATASASTSTSTPNASTVTAGVTWHRLSLLDGWTSAGSLGTGYPSWTVQGGVVYLSGSVRQGSGNYVKFAVLPPAARPAHLVLTPMYTFGGTNGWFEIYPTGQIYASSNPYSNAQDFTSLAGISFPAAGTTTHILTLLNGWSRSHTYWDTAPSYAIVGGMVYLAGALDHPSGSSFTFGVLPKAARPAHTEYITVATSNETPGGETPGVLRISPNGAMEAYGGSAPTKTWIGGVAFPPAATTSHKLALVNGWISGQSRWNSGDPSYSVSGGVVHLSGSLIQSSAGPDTFATLPPAARPRHSLYIKVYTYAGSVGTLYIQSNGIMQAYGPVSGDATRFTSLAAISFPLGS